MQFLSSKYQSLGVALLVVLGSASYGFASPVSSCVTISSQNLSCSLYESDNGSISNVVTLPYPVGPGDLILEDASANFVDVVEFTDTTAVLINASNAMFPTLAVAESSSYLILTENSVNPTVYNADGNTYSLYTISPVAATPEPASFALAATGLAGMWGAVRRRIRNV